MPDIPEIKKDSIKCHLCGDEYDIGISWHLKVIHGYSYEDILDLLFEIVGKIKNGTI